MMSMRALAAAICVMSSATLACSSSDGDAGGCSAVKACGGNVLGSWKVVSACNLVASTPAMLDDCPEASSVTTVDEATGMVVFDKDTFSRQIRFQAHVQLRFPDSCKPKLGAELCADLSGALDDGTELECTTAATGGGCSCEAVLVTEARESGVYSLRGNQVELPQDNEDYCVQNNQLSMSPRVTMNMGNAGEVTLSLRTTLSKL